MSDEIVCPLVYDPDNTCWVGRNGDPDDGVDIISWLKDEMLDGISHACAHEVDGPSIFGFDENGVPNFEVYRPTPRSWGVRARPGWKPANIEGFERKE